MLSQKLVRAASSAVPRSSVRAFSTTLLQQTKKAPSMGDINPSRGQIKEFSQKQKEFREHLVEAQKERDASALNSQLSANIAADTKSSNSQPIDAGQTAQVTESEPGRKAGPLTNLIYGTKEGRELEAQLEASFSQVLARGKYVHSIVFHEVKPDKVDEYVELVGQWYPKMANTPENKVHLVGSWRTEVGDCDTFGKFSPFLLLSLPGCDPKLIRAG